MKKLTATLRDENNLKGPIRMNLQMFNGEGDGGSGEDNPPTDPPTDPPAEPKSYTQEQLDKLLQAEGDRRVTSAREKFEKEYKEKLEKEKKEVERLANLSAEEKERELLEKSKKDIEDRENALKLKELKLDAIDILVEKKLPIKFADMLLKDSAESTMENIKLFEKEWQEAINNAVTEKLKGKTPPAGNGSGIDDIVSIANSRNQEHKPEINPWG